MFPTVLIEMLEKLVAIEDATDEYFPAHALRNVEEKLGWKFGTENSGSGSGYLESPCGKYIFKHHYVSDTSIRAFGLHTIPACAIPTRVIRVLDPLGEKSAVGNYRFSLQMKGETDVNDDAYAALRDKVSGAYDVHGGNVAYYNGRVVLIDW